MPYKDKTVRKAFMRTYTKKWRLDNRGHRLEWAKANPWVKTLCHIRYRCNNPKYSSYNTYGGRGIKANITAAELKILWFRDKAYNMGKPSIDRKDKDGSYTFENCQYMELSDNAKKRNVQRPQKQEKVLK